MDLFDWRRSYAIRTLKTSQPDIHPLISVEYHQSAALVFHALLLIVVIPVT
jgi:hypothetical protein